MLVLCFALLEFETLLKGDTKKPPPPFPQLCRAVCTVKSGEAYSYQGITLEWDYGS